MNIRYFASEKILSLLCVSLFFPWIALAQQQEIGWILAPDYESVSIDTSSVIRVKMNGVWGLFGYDGKAVMAPKYDRIGEFSEGYAPFEQDGKIGFVDTLGKEVIAPRYIPENQDSLDMVFDNPIVKYQVNVFRDGAVVVNDGGVYRLIGKTGEPLMGDDIRIDRRSGNVFIIKRHSMYGLAGLHGEVLVEPKYARIEEILPGQLFSFFIMGSWGLFNEFGERISQTRFVDVQPFTGHGNAMVRVWYEDGKQALLDKDGNVIFKPQYQSVIPMDIPGFYMVEQQGVAGVARQDGTPVVPLDYKKIRTLAGADTLFIAQKDYHYTVFDAQGNIHYSGTDRVMVDMTPAGDLVAWFEGACGIMNADGEWILDPLYEEIYLVLDRVAAVKQKDGFGAINIQTKETVLPCRFKRVKSPKNGKYFAFFDAKDSSVLCTQDGKLLYFTPTDEVDVFENYVDFKRKKKQGRLYVDGAYIAPEYNSLITLDEEHVAVQTAKGWQYMNKNTRKLLSSLYFSSVSFFAGGYTVAVNEGKVQFLDTNLNPIFTLCQDCRNLTLSFLEIAMARMRKANYAVVTVDKKQGVLNLKR